MGSLRIARGLAAGWLLSVGLSVIAVPALLLARPLWHAVRLHLQQLGLVQTWISIAACVGLMVVSRSKHAESDERWAQGALLIYVLGGLLSAIVLNYGVLPQFLARSHSLPGQIQVAVLALLHVLCAVQTVRSLWRQPPVA